MKYLFGPVNSRRLGISLGIDLVPFKTCSMNCVYCECGKTTRLTSEIAEYVPTAGVIGELKSFLSPGPRLDALTFSGSGEPTLHSGIGEIIAFLKRDFPAYRVVVLTNGSLMWMEKARRSVLQADIIIPSLDAVSEDVCRRINRPVSGVSAEKMVGGLEHLRSEFTGKIFLEIFILPGINDSAGELERIRQAAGRIRPDRIQLNTLDRPGTEEWVRPAPREDLERVARYLAEYPVDITGNPDAVRETGPGRGGGDIAASILATIERRPSTAEDLSVTLGIRRDELLKILAEMQEQGIVEIRTLERGEFYSLRKDMGAAEN